MGLLVLEIELKLYLLFGLRLYTALHRKIYILGFVVAFAFRVEREEDGKRFEEEEVD